MTGTDRARADLHRLLDRHESNPASTRLGITVERSWFHTQRELDEYLGLLDNAAASGGITLHYQRGRNRHSPPRVRLGEPAALYHFLCRTPSHTAADDALASLKVSLPLEPWMAPALEEIHGAWSGRRDWWGIPVGQAARIAHVAALAAAIVADRHLGQDYRSLSVAVTGDSKFLERHEAAVARFVSFGRQLLPGPPRTALSSIGLDRIAMPLHLSGPITLGGHPLPEGVPYLGVPHSAIAEIGFERPPRLLLTIENFVSFHRHALDANPSDRDLVIYTGGQPSFSWQNSVLSLRKGLPEELPIFHWSDIDAGGLEIFRRMESIFGTVRPHLMSTDLAELYGTIPSTPVARLGQFRGSAIAFLSDYLSSPTGRCVEQEAIEPVAPQLDGQEDRMLPDS